MGGGRDGEQGRLVGLAMASEGHYETDDSSVAYDEDGRKGEKTMSDPKLEEKIAAMTAVFAKDEGVWDAETEIRPGPGATPLRTKGVSANKRIGGGRWLVVDYRTDSGFEGHGIYGWDARAEKYAGVWVDSMQTAISRAEGSWDPATKTMTYHVEATHGGQKVRYREETRTQPDGSLLYRHLVPTPDGGEFEMIRTIYRKRP